MATSDTSTTTRERIAPVEAPYEPDVGAQLRSMMPAGVEPIGLFRTFVRNLPMAEAMHGWGRYELGRHLSVPMRAREIVIDRTCARCGCEYEWGGARRPVRRPGRPRRRPGGLTHPRFVE